MKRESVIGNIANDLGVDIKHLFSRNVRIDTKGRRRRYCDINQNSGDFNYF
uniref:Cadherin N-terminal domain-containing protein n=1 Tax=Anguilla anguilla TaxID=7936 RepID=A0A0E9V303_ANGAN